MIRNLRPAMTMIFAILLVVASPAWTAQQPMMPVAGAPRAPDFALPDLAGKRHKLSDYRGKLVVVNFWATWCPPCREELPSMQRVFKQLKDKNFVILGVEVGEEWDTVQPFVDQFAVKYPILLDNNSAVSREWKIIGLPATYFVDPQGRITHAIHGSRDWDDARLRLQIMKLLPARH